MMLTMVGRLTNDIYKLLNITKLLEMKYVQSSTRLITWFGFVVATSALWFPFSEN
jgi:hypothetical protein